MFDLADTVNITHLADKVASILDDFTMQTSDMMQEAIDDVAKMTRKEIKANAQNSFGGTGKYAKSWKISRPDKTRLTYSKTVHAGAGGYSLAHLLEHGHATRNGGRYSGVEHIAPAEEKAADELLKRIKEGIAR